MKPQVRPGAFTFERPSPAVIHGVFVACSNYIYKHDNVSPAAAFHELVKIVFLKLRADRELHRKHGALAGRAVPLADVEFSVAWIEAAEARHRHPLDRQFQALCAELEQEIRRGSQKRIFDAGERLALEPDTAKAVVGMLERYDLFGVDEDLNGRLFEAFLNATMRGRELGQYFTPRSVVKLVIELAELQVGPEHVDRVIDPCCGSGGFLIEALATLARKLDAAGAPEALRRRLREDSLWGIDIGREPPIARIARINLHLHGDAGRRVYVAEALDKSCARADHDAEVAELEGAITAGFDVIVTNPPFAKEYEPRIPADGRILAAYDLTAAAADGKLRFRSSEMFIERYRDLLVPGGKVLAVLDDSLLGNKRFARVRAFMREHFILRAVISLPGDAFQRAGARVKTSIVSMTRRRSPAEVQPDVFMWYCTAVGVEDSARQRVDAGDAARREAARAEVAAIAVALRASRAGDASHLVPASALTDRLDVKSCLLRPGRKVAAWQGRGLAVQTVGGWVTPRASAVDVAGDQPVRLLSVRYDGQAEAPVACAREAIKYTELRVARAGDIVVSHINAVHGAICVLPEALDGAAVSPEYTVLAPRPGVSAFALWAILRSPEVRAELLTRASGLGRHRIDAELLLALPVPAPTAAVAAAADEAFRRALVLEGEATTLRAQAQAAIEAELELRSESAERIILAFKPPR